MVGGRIQIRSENNYTQHSAIFPAHAANNQNYIHKGIKWIKFEGCDTVSLGLWLSKLHRTMCLHLLSKKQGSPWNAGPLEAQYLRNVCHH
jgi:hypothetical protein